MKERIQCRLCGKTIRNPEKRTYCPYCNERIKTEEETKAEALSRIEELRADGRLEKIRELNNSYSRFDAVKELEKIYGYDAVEIYTLLALLAEQDRNIEGADSSDVKNTTQIKPNHNLTSCKACGQSISRQATSCPHCGHPTGVHVCPKCGSTNTQVITNASKAVSTWLWGAFAANKVVSKYECKDCWHKF